MFSTGTYEASGGLAGAAEWRLTSVMSKLLCGPAAVLLIALTISGKSTGAEEESDFSDIKAPEHGYWERPLNDPLPGLKSNSSRGI